MVEYAAFSQTGRIPVNPHKVNQDSHWAVEVGWVRDLAVGLEVSGSSSALFIFRCS